jgi:two-component system, chemotaxis family, sensor kinase CheA
MSPENPQENLFAEFFDDYFAESEEHLTSVRNNLLVLEQFIENPQIPRPLMEQLFRSFHTLKGLSGMVGLKEAQQLSHQMEDYLRVLRDQKVIFSGEGMDALIAGEKLLEQVINCYKDKTNLPDISLVLLQISALIPEKTEKREAVDHQTSSPPAITVSEPELLAEKLPDESDEIPELNLKPEENENLISALQTGDTAWYFQFIPSNERADQGINVNKIRENLKNIGNIVYSAPRVLPNKTIIFDFLLTTKITDENTFIQWNNDGLTWHRWPIKKESKTEVETIVIPPIDEVEKMPITTVKNINEQQTKTTEYRVGTSSVVRVDLGKLDDLMRMVGDLVISRSRLEDNISKLQKNLSKYAMRPLKEVNQAIERQLRELRTGVMRVRLVPIAEVFTRMQFLVRDLARESGKDIELQLVGQETEIDKFVVERMIEPLLHLVRNAVSHGLETPTERQKVGKNSTGKMQLLAATAGEIVVIEITDDGRGIDVEKVRKRALEKNLIEPDLDKLDSVTLLELICAGGLSTKDEADMISGRGVGMGVVKNTVLELGGQISLETKLNQGTKFRIELPLTLAIADVLTVKVAQEIYAVPLSSVREVIEVDHHKITYLENNQIISYRAQVLPLLRLKTLFKTDLNQEKTPEQEEFFRENVEYAIVVGSGLDLVGILVDRIIGKREIVVHPLIDPLVHVLGISGATQLGDGRVVLILDIAQIKSKLSRLKNLC